MSITGEGDLNFETKSDSHPIVGWSYPASAVPQKTLLSTLEKIVSNMDLKKRRELCTVDSADPAEQPESYYQILGLQRLATNETIEVAFLRKVRILLRGSSNSDMGLSRKAKQELASLYTARDILLDSRCRDDHDFRLLSLRFGQQKTARNHIEAKYPVNDNSAEIVEALTFAELVEPAEIKLALEMHRSSNQTRPFSEFLYQNQMIGLEELESALLGRELVKRGAIAQEALKWVFKARYYFNVDFIDSLLATIDDITLENLIELARQLNLKIIAARVASKSQSIVKRPAATI
jgi:hypothetical protein